MKVLQVSPQLGEDVITESDEFVRYGKGAWFRYYGDDLHPVFSSKEEELEEAYQQYLKEM